MEAIHIRGNKQPGAERLTISRGLRKYLFCTAAVCGAAVMIIEILGAKMLSPYFGLSQFVWTAQIAVTLAALATGYYVGGRLGDAVGRLALLYWSILGAGLYLGFTVVICGPVSYWCLDYHSLALASLLASGILFFIPLALLAMTSPFLVRFMTASLEGAGSSAGRLASVSTLGSFVGTLSIGYFLIPHLPNSVTMYVTAGVLALAALGFFASFKAKAAVPATLLVLAIGLGCGFQTRRTWTPHYAASQQLFGGNSHFGQLQVMELRDGSERFYLNDYVTMATYDPRTKQSTAPFTYALSGLARATTTNITDILCIGLGAGIVPMEFAGRGARVDVVEINPAVVPIAGRYFDFRTNLVNLAIDDGRHFLNRCRKQYDAIILDAFVGDSPPAHLMTREAFASMRRALRPGGVLVINTWGNLQPGRDFFTASLDRTLRGVFRGVRAYASSGCNLFFTATDRPGPEFVHPPDLEGVHPRALLETRAIYANQVQVPCEHGRVLTDNYNPAEFYDASNREEIRRLLALAARPD